MGEAKRRAAAASKLHPTKQEFLANLFTARGIPYQEPGFYDHANFLIAEEDNKSFLDHYGDWVLHRKRDDRYNDHVRDVIQKLAPLLTSRIERHQWVGACLAIAPMLSRMLDRLGVWNVFVKGSVSLVAGNYFHNFAEIDENEGQGFEQGHAWIIAPPYNIVDLTLLHQRWRANDDYLRERIPSVILEEDTRIVEPALQDIFAPRFLEAAPDEEMLAYLAKSKRYAKRFPTRLISRNGLQIKYVVSGISASNEPLEGINTEARAGAPAIEIWAQDVMPAFNLLP